MAALAFAQTIDEAVTAIAEAPLRYPIGEYDTREYVITRRFPYKVVYRLRKTDVVIVAIAHESREPGYWQYR